MKSRPSTRPAAVVAACILVTALAAGVRAANVTWVGNTDANWNTTANWAAGGTPAGHTPVFDVAGTSGTSLNNDLIAGATIVGMTFNAAAPAYDITGNSISLTGNIVNNSTNTQTVDLDMALTVQRTVSGVGPYVGPSVVLGGDISGTGGALRFMRVSGSGQALFELSGNNNYTGVTDVFQNARLEITNPNALAGTSMLLLNSSTFANYSGADVNVASVSFANGATFYLTNNLTSTGTGTVALPATIHVYDGTLTIPSLTGTHNITKQQNGTLAVTGASLFYSGTVGLNGGILLLGHPQALGTAAGFNWGPPAGTLQASSDLSGANKLPYNINYTTNSAVFSGSNNIEVGGVFRAAFTGGQCEFSNNIVSGKTLTLNNVDLALGTDNRELRLHGTGDTVILGNIAEADGKIGVFWTDSTGTLTLHGNNTYQGRTHIAGTLVRLESVNAIPGGIGVAGGTNYLRLGDGGVLGLGADSFFRSVGTLAGQVQLATSAGFAAYHADRVVNLGGASAGMVWGAANFVSGSLILGADSATHTLTFENPLNLGASGTNTRTVHVPDGAAAVDAVLSGALTQTGGTQSLAKTGDGTLVLTGPRSYAGSTTVSGGALLAYGNHTGAGDYIVNAATLGGTGTIALTAGKSVTVNTGSTLIPGASVGTLTISGGDLNLNGSVTLDFELGWTQDLIEVLGGDVNFGSGTHLTVNVWYDGTVGLYRAGTQIPLIDYSGVSSGFDDVTWTVNVLSPSLNDLGAALGDSGSFIYLFGVESAVPEPQSLLLMALGLAALRGCRRRRRQG